MTECTDEQVLAVAMPILKVDEGCKLTAYKDTRNIWTIGYGHAFVAPDTVWTQAQADAQLAEDVQSKITALDHTVPQWRELDPIRASVILMMAFNLGVNGLLAFHNTLNFVWRGMFALAAHNMLASAWSTQVGDRAQRLAFMMRTGSLPVMK